MGIFKKKSKDLSPKTEESVAEAVSAEQLDELYSDWDRCKAQKREYGEKINLLEKEIDMAFEQIEDLYKHSDKIFIDYQFVIDYADGSKAYYKLLGPLGQYRIKDGYLRFLRVGTDWTQMSVEEITIRRSVCYAKQRITFEEFKEAAQTSINHLCEFIDTFIPQLSTTENVICHHVSESDNNNQYRKEY